MNTITNRVDTVQDMHLILAGMISEAKDEYDELLDAFGSDDDGTKRARHDWSLLCTVGEKLGLED